MWVESLLFTCAFLHPHVCSGYGQRGDDGNGVGLTATTLVAFPSTWPSPSASVSLTRSVSPSVAPSPSPNWSGVAISNITAGPFHTCVLVTAGIPYCFGYNADGRVGNGLTLSQIVPSLVAGLGGARITSIAGGGYVDIIQSHSCAVSAAGALSCWGANKFGQVGDGTNGTNRLTPVGVVGLSGAVVTGVACGAGHTCALLQNGTVRCWGDNALGQLGDSSVVTRFTPSLPVTGLPEPVAQLALGAFHSCAVLATSRSVMCWGYNGDGQLGGGAVSLREVTPVPVLGSTAVIALAVGYHHGCILVASGSVQCWGYNPYGALGDSTTTPSSRPGTVLTLSGITVIAAGSYHTCAGNATGVWCFGRGGEGQLGHGPLSSRTLPVRATGLSGIIAMAAGIWHSCALLANGNATCWGANSEGQLGDGTAVARPTVQSYVTLPWMSPSPSMSPTPSVTPSPTRSPNWAGVSVVNITAGSSHTCALSSVHGLLCWYGCLCCALTFSW